MGMRAGFMVIYSWDVASEAEADFVAAWAEMTELIREHRGGLGSRLHRDGAGRLVAYAEWPSREVYEADTPLPASAEAVSERMRAAVLRRHEPVMLEPLRDLLSR